jgi:hypothetical protein
MGLLRSRKPKEAATEGDDVTTSPPLALAPEGDEEPTPAGQQSRQANADSTWVRLGSDVLWAGVLPDEALASLPSLEDPPAKAPTSAETRLESKTPAKPQTPATPPRPTTGADPLELAASRTQEPGGPDFRILCGATTPSEIRRRFSWKTDKELAEAYEIALHERKRVAGTGDEADLAYWDALAETSVKEAASRPTFGELNEWEEEHDRREQRESARRLEALAKAREALLQSNRSS